MTRDEIAAAYLRPAVVHSWWGADPAPTEVTLDVGAYGTENCSAVHAVDEDGRATDVGLSFTVTKSGSVYRIDRNGGHSFLLREDA